MKIKMFLILIILVVGNSFSASNDSISEIAFSIDPTKYGIQVNFDSESGAESGPTSFQIIGDKLAIEHSNSKEILIINREGTLVKRIKFKTDIGSFELDSIGNGFVGVLDSLYIVNNFNVLKKCTPKFSMKGNWQGRFRIDFIPNNQVRVISFAPDFVVTTSRDSICKVSSKHKSQIDSLLIEQLSIFAGSYKNYYVFSDYNETKANEFYLKVFAFDKSSNISDSKKIELTGINYGYYIMWSYALRMNEEKGCFYGMFYNDKKIEIRKFDLHKLLGI